VVERFWTGFVFFHGVLLILTALVARRWARRLAGGAPPGGWLGAVVGDSVLWGGTALVLAVVLAGLGDDDFTAVRLLSQALFGELVVLTAGIAALCWRRGRRPWAAVVALACTTLVAAYAEAYHREPTDLQVRRYAGRCHARRPGPRAHPDRAALGHPGRPHRSLRGAGAPHRRGSEGRSRRADRRLRPAAVRLRGAAARRHAEKDHGRPERLLREVRFDATLGMFAVRGDVDLDWPRVFDGTPVTTLTGEIATRPLPGAARSALSASRRA
jgi:hypothetical protein